MIEPDAHTRWRLFPLPWLRRPFVHRLSLPDDPLFLHTNARVLAREGHINLARRTWRAGLGWVETCHII
jgi:hypothetical protein